MIKVFLDANILVDILDNTRVASKESAEVFTLLVQQRKKYRLYTSCDLVTTIYYLTQKFLGKVEALAKIKILNKVIKIIEFGNNEIDEAIELMQRDDKYKDLEDTIQYIMARKERCDYIITNDKGFVSGDVPMLTSKEALLELG